MPTRPQSPEIRRWEAEHADLVVDTVNQLRDDAGLTIRDLSVQLERWGWPVGLPTLNGMLSPARKRQAFTVAEILAFARALEVSPLTILLGLRTSAELPAGALLPEGRSTLDALRWLLGETPDGWRRSHDAAAALARYSEALGLMQRRNEALQAALIGESEPGQQDGARLMLGNGIRAEWSEVLRLRATPGVAFPPLPEPLVPWADKPVDELPVPVEGFADEARVRDEVVSRRSGRAR